MPVYGQLLSQKSSVHGCRQCMQRRCMYDNCSLDSQFPEEEEDELSFLEGCMECDEDAIYDLIQDGVTVEQVNERDRSGRTGLSHACANGFLPVVELLCDVEEVDANLPDNEGNTPLIFAAQAGHSEVVSFLLHHYKGVRVDFTNHLGFSALIKAAIQGRTRCCKLLLFGGASPRLRDHGRGYCAEEWARFCGRKTCADAIAKWVRSKKYHFAKMLLPKDKWNSEPNLAVDKNGSDSKSGFFQKFLNKVSCNNNNNARGSITNLRLSPLAHAARCASTPIIPQFTSPPESPDIFRRASCIDGALARDIPKLLISIPPENVNSGSIVQHEPPEITKSTFTETEESAA